MHIVVKSLGFCQKPVLRTSEGAEYVGIRAQLQLSCLPIRMRTDKTSVRAVYVIWFRSERKETILIELGSLEYMTKIKKPPAKLASRKSQKLVLLKTLLDCRKYLSKKLVL